MAKKAQDQDDLVDAIVFTKEDGWFVATQVRIPKPIIDQKNVVKKYEPDVFQNLLNNCERSIRTIYELW